MNKYKELYEKDGSDPNIVDEIKESFRTTNDKDWVDLYWASKYLFQYDKTGETDSLIIECLEVALESGLHFEKDKLAFLDASKILARTYFKYSGYKKAENNLMLLRNLSDQALPDWVFLYSLATNYMIDIGSAIQDASFFSEVANRIDFSNEDSAHQYTSLVKDYLNKAKGHIERYGTDSIGSIDFEIIKKNVSIALDEASEEWNSFILAYYSSEGINRNEEVRFEQPNLRNIRALTGLLDLQASRISSLETKLLEMESQISSLLSLQKIEEPILDHDHGAELIPKLESGENVDDNLHVVTGRKPKVLIFGASQISIEHMIGIAKLFGLDKDQLEFMIDYDQNKRFDFNKIRYNSPYGGILIGPVAHKIVGLGDNSSLIEKLMNEEGYPHVEVIKTSSGELKITKTAFKDAMKKLVAHMESVSLA